MAVAQINGPCFGCAQLTNTKYWASILNSFQSQLQPVFATPHLTYVPSSLPAQQLQQRKQYQLLDATGSSSAMPISSTLAVAPTPLAQPVHYQQEEQHEGSMTGSSGETPPTPLGPGQERHTSSSIDSHSEGHLPPPQVMHYRWTGQKSDMPLVPVKRESLDHGDRGNPRT